MSNANGRPAPRNNRWVWYFATLGVLTVIAVGTLIYFNLQQQLTPEKLSAAKALWKANGPRDYDMTYTIEVGKPETFDVRVRGGKVVAVTLDGSPLEERLYIHHSMEGLFGNLERFVEMTARPDHPRTYMVANFDQKNGRLTRFVRRVTPTRERVEILVKRFEPLAPSAPKPPVDPG